MTAKLIIILTIISTSIFAQVDCEKYTDKYIPTDLNDALNYLDCIWSKSDKDTFRLKPENDATVSMHFGTGMGIRNSWGLWKGESGISKYFRDLGITHPDDMSSIILTSFHRYLNKTDIRLDDQIKHYINYWEKAKQDEIKRMKDDFKYYNVNDTVDFMYEFDFISEKQEKDYMADNCNAHGIVLDKDSIEFRLKIKLIESCDSRGIIISKRSIYEKKDSIWVKQKREEVEIMKNGDIKWLSYKFWE